MVAVSATLVWYRREYTELRPTWSWSSIAIGLAVFALWMALEPRHSRSVAGLDPGHALAPVQAFAWLCTRVLGSVLVVPLVEEMAFRGYLFRRLIAADFQSVRAGRLTWVSLALSSAAFGALHQRWLAGTLAGAGYALAFSRRGEITDAVVAHGLTNALIAAYVLATGCWDLWA
jgi:CAAX prenyl protease-like protein